MSRVAKAVLVWLWYAALVCALMPRLVRAIDTTGGAATTTAPKPKIIGNPTVVRTSLQWVDVAAYAHDYGPGGGGTYPYTLNCNNLAPNNSPVPAACGGALSIKPSDCPAGGNGQSNCPYVGWDDPPAPPGSVCTGQVGPGCGGVPWQSDAVFYFAPGFYTQRNDIAIIGNGVAFSGGATGVTVIVYAPPSDGHIMWHFGGQVTDDPSCPNPLLVCQCAALGHPSPCTVSSWGITVRDFQIQSPPGNHFTKTAIQGTALNWVDIHNVRMLQCAWNGPFSIGLYVQGNEFWHVYDSTFTSALPMYVEGTPPDLFSDHHFGVSTFENISYQVNNNDYTGDQRCFPPTNALGATSPVAPSGPNVVIEPHTELQDITFNGKSFVFGTYGVSWLSYATNIHNNVTFENLRWERMERAKDAGGNPQAQAGYMFFIAVKNPDPAGSPPNTSPQPLLGLTIRNSSYGNITPGHLTGGIYLQNVADVLIDSFHDSSNQQGSTSNPGANAFITLNNSFPTTILNSWTLLPSHDLLLPQLGVGAPSPICKTFGAPRSSNTVAFGGVSIPFAVYDVPLSGAGSSDCKCPQGVPTC